MTVSTAKTKFNELKTAILADGKVDLTEVDVLLSFVEGYIVNDKFLQFKNLLLQCKADGKITKEESDTIIKEIDFLTKFLTIETIIEKIIVFGLGAFAIGFIIYKMFFA